MLVNCQWPYKLLKINWHSNNWNQGIPIISMYQTSECCFFFLVLGYSVLLTRLKIVGKHCIWWKKLALVFYILIIALGVDKRDLPQIINGNFRVPSTGGTTDGLIPTAYWKVTQFKILPATSCCMQLFQLHRMKVSSLHERKKLLYALNTNRDIVSWEIWCCMFYFSSDTWKQLMFSHTQF